MLLFVLVFFYCIEKALNQNVISSTKNFKCIIINYEGIVFKTKGRKVLLFFFFCIFKKVKFVYKKFYALTKKYMQKNDTSSNAGFMDSEMKFDNIIWELL